MSERYDCVVVGGGPAGTVAAAFASQTGLRTLLVERDRQPRVGPAESLSPAAGKVLATLGLTPNFAVGHLRHELVSQLHAAAQDRGVTLLSDATATKVLFAGEQAMGVRIELPTGKLRDVTGQFLIDASGQAGLIAGQFGWKPAEPAPEQAAIWGIYAGVRRAKNGGQASFPAGGGGAEFRLSALADDLDCLSLIGDAAYLLAGRGAPEEILEDELVGCPELAQRLIEARLVERFHVALRHPFAARRTMGEGWQIIGDAGGPADLGDFAALASAILSGYEAAQSLASSVRSVIPRRWPSISAAKSPC
ncbi:MAG: FAD-dependent oxidoreductase [Pirellulaceae bacterium]|nr:FAD-dependent oxidoreductase [Pirellulaceae bacterium]